MFKRSLLIISFAVWTAIFCNMRFAIGYSNASLSGTYFFSGFGKSSVGPDRWSQIGTVTFNGAGSTTYSYTYSSSRNGINLTDSGTGTYSVNSDGMITFYGFPGETGETTKGAIQDGANTIVFADVDEQQEQIFGVLVKKGDSSRESKAMPWIPLLLLDD